MKYILIVKTGWPERVITHVSGHKSVEAATRKMEAIGHKTKVDMFGAIYEAGAAPQDWQFVTNMAL